jgi:hypothetical protein
MAVLGAGRILINIYCLQDSTLFSGDKKCILPNGDLNFFFFLTQQAAFILNHTLSRVLQIMAQ